MSGRTKMAPMRKTEQNSMFSARMKMSKNYISFPKNSSNPMEIFTHNTFNRC